MKKSIIAILLVAANSGIMADSSFGPSDDLQKFYSPFNVQDIPLSEMQSWPYYEQVVRAKVNGWIANAQWGRHSLRRPAMMSGAAVFRRAVVQIRPY